MPNRRLPERGRAREQLDQYILRRLRFLERRVRYPGKVRFVTEPRTIYVPAPTPVGSEDPGGVVLLSLALSPGRWKIESSSNVELVAGDFVEVYPWGFHPDGSTIDENIPGFDPDTGDPVGSAFGLGRASTAYAVPFSTLGVGVWPDGGRVDLIVIAADGPSTLVRFVHTWLMATPV